MGKTTFLGSARKDDPIYSGVVEIFSPLESKASSLSSAKSRTGETQKKSAPVVSEAKRE